MAFFLMSDNMKIVIVGGVGAGASMAFRLRCLSKDGEIIILAN